MAGKLVRGQNIERCRVWMMIYDIQTCSSFFGLCVTNIQYMTQELKRTRDIKYNSPIPPSIITC